MGSINADGSINGKVRKNIMIIMLSFFRNNYNGISKESFIEKLEKRKFRIRGRGI